MRSVQSFVQSKNARSIFLLLIAVLMSGGILISPVMAVDGYTQGWMGAPDWVMAEKEGGNFDLPDFFYPKDVNTTKGEEPNLSSYIEHGNKLLAGGSFAEAKQNYEKAIGISSNSYDAWVGRGYALEGLKRSQTALDSFEKAIGFSNSIDHNWIAYAGKGRVLTVLQRYKDATEAFRSAIDAFEAQSSGTLEDHVMLYQGLAEAAQKSGDMEESSAALGKAEELKRQGDLNSTA
ncbi:MAG: tetratricopeptide repeat protein [Methanobacteriota archaeon]